MRLSASMSKVNATAQRLPSGQGIGFWITIGSFVRDEFGRETPGRATRLNGGRHDRTAAPDRPAIARSGRETADARRLSGNARRDPATRPERASDAQLTVLDGRAM